MLLVLGFAVRCPEHTLSLEQLIAEQGAVARSPFDVQFISASTTESVKRLPVGLRVASVGVALSCFELGRSPLLHDLK